MKAIRIHYSDSASTLHIDEVPKPEPGPNELLIKTQAIGMNRADLGRRRTATAGQPEPPAPLGLDAGGVVEAMGKDVKGFSLGDKVVALSRGTYAEYVVAPAVRTYHVPYKMTITDASSLPCAFLTAYYGLATLGELKRGETALIHAAGSGVGMAGIQIAKAMGARVLTTAGSDQKISEGRRLGAEAGVNYSTGDVGDGIMKLTNSRGVDVVLDSVGGTVFDSTLKCLALAGRVVTVGAPAGARAAVDEKALAAKYQMVKGSSVFRDAEADPDKKGWAQLKGWLEQGKIHTVITKVFPWTQAEEAQKMLADRAVFGKLVLTV